MMIILMSLYFMCLVVPCKSIVIHKGINLLSFDNYARNPCAVLFSICNTSFLLLYDFVNHANLLIMSVNEIRNDWDMSAQRMINAESDLNYMLLFHSHYYYVVYFVFCMLRSKFKAIGALLCDISRACDN
jgi:hypothetical protein